MGAPIQETRRLRLLSGIAAAGCLVLGLATQALDRSPLADVVGSVLYVCCIGLSTCVAWPRLSSIVIASLAFGFAVSVELIQVTGMPSEITAVFPPARLLLGSAFDPLDLIAYGGGALLLFVALVGLTMLARRPGVTEP
jgi:Protein of unknown function (DUF2809)